MHEMQAWQLLDRDSLITGLRFRELLERPMVLSVFELSIQYLRFRILPIDDMHRRLAERRGPACKRASFG